jgi:hypothetical protein
MSVGESVTAIKLPDSLRAYLAEPHGRLYQGTGKDTVEKIEELGNFHPLVCVGDLVTYYVLKSGFLPELVVIDFKTVRDRISPEMVEFMRESLSRYNILRVKNPPAHITLDLVESLINAVDSIGKERTCIVVDGEEDLATIPLVYLLPHNSLLLYGQPGEGIVAVVVGAEKKNIILDILKKMEVLEGGEKVINLIKIHGIP